MEMDEIYTLSQEKTAQFIFVQLLFKSCLSMHNGKLCNKFKFCLHQKYWHFISLVWLIKKHLSVFSIYDYLTIVHSIAKFYSQWFFSFLYLKIESFISLKYNVFISSKQFEYIFFLTHLNLFTHNLSLQIWNYLAFQLLTFA